MAYNVQLNEVLCESIKPRVMSWRATQNGQVIVESSDKRWSTGEDNGKPLQYSSFGDPMRSMKRQKDMILEDEPPRSIDIQYATGEEQRNSSRTMKKLGQSKNDTEL